MNIKEDFTSYLYEEAGSSGRGTVSTYIRALDILDEAIKLGKEHIPAPSVWAIESPSDLIKLQKFVLDQQHEYAEGQSGIFATLKNVGQSYFKKRWCSAAVRQLAAFRQTRIYETALEGALHASSTGEEVAEKSQAVKIKTPSCFVPDSVNPSSREGKEAVALAKHRINQSVFRKWVIGLYRNECCITGLNIPEVLRASHIVSWASDERNRMNPSNGLCLSATYDAAFDRHLISFDDDYRMVLSPRIKDFCTREICAKYFLKFEGVRMNLPVRFFPDLNLLEKHRSLLVS